MEIIERWERAKVNLRFATGARGVGQAVFGVLICNPPSGIFNPGWLDGAASQFRHTTRYREQPTKHHAESVAKSSEEIFTPRKSTAASKLAPREVIYDAFTVHNAGSNGTGISLQPCGYQFPDQAPCIGAQLMAS